MGKISVERKISEGRGMGWGEFYRAWIKIREFNSRGTATAKRDWFTGRMVQLLSIGELWWYIILRVKMHAKDILEQYPLDPNITRAVAKALGLRLPSERERMTTDFLVLTAEGNIEAYSVKADRKALADKSQKRSLDIEEGYWRLLGIPHHLVFKEDLNETEVLNYQDVMRYYNPRNIRCRRGLVKHMIAIGLLEVNMTQEIDFTAIADELEETYDLESMVRFVLEGTYSDAMLVKEA